MIDLTCNSDEDNPYAETAGPAQRPRAASTPLDLPLRAGSKGALDGSAAGGSSGGAGEGAAFAGLGASLVERLKRRRGGTTAGDAAAPAGLEASLPAAEQPEEDLLAAGWASGTAAAAGSGVAARGFAASGRVPLAAVNLDAGAGRGGSGGAKKGHGGGSATAAAREPGDGSSGSGSEGEGRGTAPATKRPRATKPPPAAAAAAPWPPPLPPRPRGGAGSGRRGGATEESDEDWEPNVGQGAYGSNGGPHGSTAALFDSGSEGSDGNEDPSEEEDYAPRRRTAPCGRKAGSVGPGSGRSRAGSAVSGDSGGADGEAAAPKRRGRKSQEEKEAEAAAKKAAQKAKQDQRVRDREAKAAAKMFEKLTKEHQRMSERQAGGNLFEREIVASLPPSLAASSIGQAFVALLQEKRWGMWRVDGTPGAALTEAVAARAGGGGAGRGGGGDGGFAVVTFQRRMLTPADIKGVPETTQLLGSFQESAPVPCIFLLFHQPAAFLSQLNALGGFRGLLTTAAALHPGCSLQAVVVGLDSHLKTLERRDSAAGGVTFSAAAVAGEVLRLQLAVPALQLRKVPNAEAAVQHLLSLTRALGQQPYKHSGRDDAIAAAGAGESLSTAAAAGMDRELGPCAWRAAACLSRVPGMGGGQVWSVCREFAGLGALTAAMLRQASAGRDPGGVISEMRDARGNQRRLGTVLGQRVALLLTTRDPDALVSRGEEGGGGG